MFGKKLFTVRGVKLKWIRSFLIVIAISMLLVLIFMLWIRSKATEEALSSHYHYSSFISHVIDEQMGQITNLSSKIMNDRTLIRMIEADAGGNIKTESAYQLVDQLRNFMIANQMIEEIYIYYPEQDYILGTLGIYRPISYYLLQNELKRTGYNRWLSMVKAADNMSFFFWSNEGKKELLFSRAIYRDSQKSSVMIIKLRKSYMESLLESANAQYPHRLNALTDDEQKVYAYYGEEILLPLVQNYNDREGYTQLRQNYYASNEHFIITEPSTFRGLHYYMINTKSNVLKIQTAITRLLMICIASMFLVGIVLSVYMSHYNSRPLRLLLGRLQPGQQDSSDNEYDVISRKMDELLEENQSAILLLRQQQRFIEESFVRTILSGAALTDKQLDAVQRTHNLGFENKYFCTIILYSDVNSVRLDEQQQQLLEKFVSDRCDDTLTVFYGAVYPNYLFILNYRAPNSETEEIAEWFTKQLSHWLADQQLPYSCVNGFVSIEQRDIYRSYQNALNQIAKSATALALIEGTDYVEQVEGQMHAAESAWNTPHDRQPFQDFGGVKEKPSNPRGQSNDEAKESGGVLASRIREIIDSQYGDAMLSLTMIAEQLQMSNSYISRVFKEQYQLGLVEYLNQVRVERAKELMNLQQLSIKEIAREVGFASDVSFIRVFKKYEHMTPGKYKQTVK
ncbi:hypothetical protein B4V02_12950 [Paenibacillus kribbensis]|uniref:HTH araC/xylS-type domain-containing protein n=1 Tax=Paenibacillus kribbensis TaxID=172713 RepID=A0A222WMY2_9BACL|nr:helix-turn-helix transcriptional regulator [Paenibacillus kribbensis]ASR47515.1 hypothetical protein B4V02_12950 [Paenibacillus kribbensis]